MLTSNSYINLYQQSSKQNRDNLQGRRSLPPTPCADQFCLGIGKQPRLDLRVLVQTSCRRGAAISTQFAHIWKRSCPRLRSSIGTVAIAMGGKQICPCNKDFSLRETEKERERRAERDELKSRAERDELERRAELGVWRPSPHPWPQGRRGLETD